MTDQTHEQQQTPLESTTVQTSLELSKIFSTIPADESDTKSSYYKKLFKASELRKSLASEWVKERCHIDSLNFKICLMENWKCYDQLFAYNECISANKLIVEEYEKEWHRSGREIADTLEAYNQGH
eukprot:TRINITY_DN185_c0_g1_i1.p1 TRINITY_DN185_c0_g1~~TRINITY_DN185_c0_g1_i1.p1  ORF type:complete len:126 (-),score=12.03 TRINITY_DN185_c0_g1_i1:90-467(-)